MVFTPKLWQEDRTPQSQIYCGKCGLDEHGTRMVWGEGTVGASVMIILDNPGMREDRDNNPMVCGTRKTLQHAIHEVGLEESHFYVTYILKRMPVKKYDKEKTRHICMKKHLNQQIAKQEPKIILCLGNVAVQSFFESSDVDVKGLRGSLHDVKGYQTAVAYHPLAVRRRPNLEKLFLEDFQFVKRKLQSVK